MQTGACTAVLLTYLLLAATGCDSQAVPPGPKVGPRPVLERPIAYVLAVHPLHNPSKLIELYQPLVDYLNAHLDGERISLEASRDYANFEDKYAARGPAFILPNPWQAIQAIKAGYHVIAMAGDPQDFRGLFVVRNDSAISDPADLKGKSVSYPSPTALAACVMPQHFLHARGINIHSDITNQYVGSQESSIMNVFLRLTSAGATWPPPWRAFQKDHPTEAKQLHVAWETAPMVNNAVMVRDDVPQPLVDRITQLLLSVGDSQEGMTILAHMETAPFLRATDDDYAIVAKFVAEFEKQVRPVKERP